jgi:hypothetical protein
MNRPSLAWCWLGSALAPLLTSACSFQMQAQSSGSGASAPATPAAKPAKAAGHKSRGKGVSVSFHESGKISGKVSGKIDWQGRSGSLCRAVSPFKFVGMAKLAGSAQVSPSGASATGHAEASGKSSGGVSSGSCEPPRSHVPATPAPVPIKNSAKPEPDKTNDTGKAPPVKEPTKEPKTLKKNPTKLPKDLTRKPPLAPTPTPEPPATPGPTPTELETPKDPPATPPENVFGYEEPVRGCFEGQVFPLAPDTAQLPTNYASLAPQSVLYACEWDIPPRSWDQGFPGIEGRFEWFAIRYAGAFRISAAGDYTFRLSSDDGSKLTIDGKVVIDNDTLHPPKDARGTVKLAAGDHQMVLEYFQGPRYQINLQLWVTPPGKGEELFTVR